MLFNFLIFQFFFWRQLRLERVHDLVQPLLRHPKLSGLGQVRRRANVLLRQVLDGAVVIDHDDVEYGLLAQVLHLADAIDATVNDVDGDPAVRRSQYLSPVLNSFC